VGLVLAPLVSSAQQIYTGVPQVCESVWIPSLGGPGGMSKYEQCKELKAGCEVVVATGVDS